MRLLLLPFAALAFATPRAAAQPALRPVVILVHGRGLLDADSAALHREWKRDLDSALVGVGLTPLPDEDVKLAWYADLDPVTPERCSSVTAGDSLSLASLLHEFVGTLAAAMPREDTPGARALLADVMYMIDPRTRCAAERRVGAVIESALTARRPVVVVAYSLGSLVTYEYLSSMSRIETAGAGVRLVTLGSPLGNDELRALLGGAESLEVPSIVRSWDNVYDESDIFAAPLGQGSALVRDRITKRGSSSDPHYIGRYLRDAETGTAVGRALCASAPFVGIEACRRLERRNPE